MTTQPGDGAGELTTDEVQHFAECPELRWMLEHWRPTQSLNLADVPGHLPARPDGTSLTVRDVVRWAVRGLHGVRLKTDGSPKAVQVKWIAGFFSELRTAMN